MRQLFVLGEKTKAIAAVLQTLPLGGTMTYADLAKAVDMVKIKSTTTAYRSAVNLVLKSGVSIAADKLNVSFRRRSADEMAEGVHRFGAVQRIAKRGSHEAREALKSNDLRTQGKASIAAAKYSILKGTRPVSNKDVPDDRLPERKTA